ncbi:hypothetical protein [Flavobacterium sp.]|uniref:hypothetical protein n=1 Tax=Flavobacterium sp. TaxID=239 RepID=UPI0037C0AC65
MFERTSSNVISIIRIHNQIYNLALETLTNEPGMDFHALKNKVRQFISEASAALNNEFLPYIESVLFNEMHYLFTRFRRKKAVYRKDNDICYMTLRVSDFIMTDDCTELTCKHFQDPILLNKQLPAVKPNGYYNLSYSPQTNRFKLAVFS